MESEPLERDHGYSLPWPEFPQLPPRNLQWSTMVHSAYEYLQSTYDHAVHVLLADGADPTRIAFHVDRISSEALPILLELVPEGEHELEFECDKLPANWLERVSALFAEVVTDLQALQTNLAERDEEHVWRPRLTILERTGRRGRPRKLIDLDFLEEATSVYRQIKFTEIANLVNIHPETLRLYRRKHGIIKRYSNISDDDLDSLVKSFKTAKPESGFRYLMGFLRQQGLRVQERRARQSLHRIDGLNRRLRESRLIRRRKYTIKRSNALWHLDGHHKLIRWGFVIHAIIDGYCRTVTGIRASTNNCASTVLDLFTNARRKYGLPSRMRGDRGGENIEVATYMVMKRGSNRGSFLWGSSTRNSRVERLWVEVGSQFARRWKAFFMRLERLHGLNIDKTGHLWLLHTLFLDTINEDCKKFQNEWNLHPGRTMANKSPQDLRLLSIALHGIYDNESGERVHRDNGNIATESETDSDAEQNHQPARVQQDQLQNVRHEAVEVPEQSSPFTVEDEEDFFSILKRIIDENIIPEGYGLLEGEIDEEDAEMIEVIPFGTRRSKSFTVQLTDPIWSARITLWVQAIELLSVFEAASRVV